MVEAQSQMRSRHVSRENPNRHRDKSTIVET